MSTVVAGSRDDGDRTRAAVPQDPLGALAARWADAVAGTSYVPLQPDQLEELLRGLLHRLLAALDEPPVGQGVVGRQVGAALVDAHFTNPQSLSETLCVLLDGEPGGGAAPSGEVALPDRRWHALVAAVAEGFSAALQERALTVSRYRALANSARNPGPY